MATLSRDEIASVARAAGFSGENLDIAVAVALAESSGNPRAHNSTPPDNSYGLWQINMLGNLGPARRKQFGLSSNDELFDPATNARAAYKIWQGSGWKAWTTYTRGTYKKHMKNDSSKLSDIMGAFGNTIPQQIEEKGNPITGVGAAINAFGDTLFKSVANVAGIGVALTLIVLGSVFLLRNAIPIGKAAKLAKKVAQ